nr:discoidin domain-containing protein [Isoptericola halotolerans]
MGDRWKIDPSTGSAGQGSRYVWAPVQVDSQTGDLTIENVGPWDPRNETLFRPLEPVAPLELEASTEDRDDFDPTFDVVVDGVRYDDLTARWSPASLDAAFSAPGTYPLEGHVAGDGPLAGRHVTATVDVTGPANLCTEPGTTVSASFHQTDYGTFPAQAACDGDHATTWSTWASGSGKQDRVSFTISLADRHRVGSVRFTSTEGTIASVGVEHQDADGSWRPVSSPSGTVAAPGAQTRISFEPVVTSGVRLTFDTPGSWLKIPEIVLPGPTGDGPQATTEAEVRCLGGRALLAVRAVNTSDGPVDVTLGSAYGTRDVADVAPGASAYQTFATRQASVEAGSVTVTVTDPTGRTAVVPTTHAGADCS